MIELSPDTACLLYLLMALVALSIVWIFHYSSSKKEILSFEKKHFQCEFCKHAFIVETNKKHARCPECQCLNKTS